MKAEAFRRSSWSSCAAGKNGLLLLLMCSCAQTQHGVIAHQQAGPPVDIDIDIDWPSFLARSDMSWSWNTTAESYKFLPVDWWNSAFLGNGNLGMQVVAALHDAQDRLPRPPAPPPTPSCCCCWNRDTQPCNTTSQCDAGGEGCVAKGTPTKRYGPAGCSCDGVSHGCHPLPSPPPIPPPPPLGEQPALRFEIGRLDITDDRVPGSTHYTGNLKCDRPRLAIGYLYLHAAGEVSSAKMRLKLWDAELSAVVRTSVGTLNVSVLTHAKSDVNIIHIIGVDGESKRGCVGISWHPIQGDSLPAWQKQVPPGRYASNPPINTTEVSAGLTLSNQQLLSGSAYASAVQAQSNKDGSCTIYQSTKGRMPADQSGTAALAEVAAAASVGLVSLRHSHQSWWHAYYPASFLSLGDTRLETFYWAQIYKAGSGTRGSVGPPSYGVFDHHGPWFAPSPTTCCILFNWDMNVQVTYWPFATANRLNISAALMHLLTAPEKRIALRANAPVAWQNDSLAGPEGHSSLWLLNDPYLNDGWNPNSRPLASAAPPDTNTTHAPSYTSNLLWALHDTWRQYAYAGDADALRAVWPVLVGHMNLHLHLLEKGSDGKLHLPPSWSPEYNEKVSYMGAGDTTYHLALVRWGLERLIEGCRLLNCTDSGKDIWTDTLSKLADFSVDPKTGALQVASNLSFSVSHRHFSHLFPCFPLGLLNASDSRCTNAVDQWYSAAMHGPWDTPTTVGDWCLWSMAVLSSLSTLMGRQIEAWSNLTTTVHSNVMPRMTPFGSALLSNTMYGEGCNSTTPGTEFDVGPCGDPTGETPFAIASALQDMMLVTDRAAGMVRVFGGAPKDAPHMVFHNLRTEGGFLVSAAWAQSRVEFVHVRSTLSTGNSQLRIAPRLGAGFRVLCNGAESCTTNIRHHADGSVTLTFAAANDTALLLPPNAKSAMVAPVASEEEYHNWWGCEEGHSAGK